MQFKIITPEKILFAGNAQAITVPGSEGVFGVLDGHAPFVSTLKPGVITLEMEDKSQRQVAVLSGIAEVTPEHCVILAENAEDCTGVDAQAKRAEAKKLMDEAITESEKKLAFYKLAMAEAIAQAA